MSLKLSYEEVKEFIESLGYILISIKFHRSNDKLIILDNENYYYFVTHASLKNGTKPSKFNISNPYTIYNIKNWCKINKKPFELISKEYKDSKKYNLLWKCLKDGCGEEFEMDWNHISNNRGCPFCKGYQVGISNCLATKSPEIASEWHPTLNGDLTTWDVTYGKNLDVWWQCSKNPEHEWHCTVNARTNIHTSGNCPYCSHILPSKEYNLLLNNPELANEWNYKKNKKTPEEYLPFSTEHVWWICKEGHEWEASIANRNGTNKNGCSYCNKSHGEKECKRVLDLRNIYFISQKIFNGLVGLGNGLLSYDFYLPKYNFLIEYQGEYHDRAILNYKNEPIELAEVRFQKRQEHDRRKREYAKNNNIRLLEIWYWDFDDIEEILQKELFINEVVNIG